MLLVWDKEKKTEALMRLKPMTPLMLPCEQLISPSLNVWHRRNQLLAGYLNTSHRL